MSRCKVAASFSDARFLGIAGAAAAVLTAGGIELVAHGDFQLLHIVLVDAAYGARAVVNVRVIVGPEQVVPCHLKREAVAQERLGEAQVEIGCGAGEVDVLLVATCGDGEVGTRRERGREAVRLFLLRAEQPSRSKINSIGVSSERRLMFRNRARLVPR